MPCPAIKRDVRVNQQGTACPAPTGTSASRAVSFGSDQSSMTDDLLKLSAVLGLVLLNGFFVAAEFALVSVRSTRIDQLIEQGNRMARLVKRAQADPNRFISAAQVGITMASLALGWIA